MLGRRKLHEYESQPIWQVQKDFWLSRYVLFPSLIKRSRVTMGGKERSGQVETKSLPNKADSANMGSTVCFFFVLFYQCQLKTVYLAYP